MAAVVAVAAAAASVRRRIAYLQEMTLKPLETNIDLALTYILTGDIDSSAVYSKTCMNLGSAIDSAIAVNAVPSSSTLPQLLFIVKEVYRRKTELLQPSLMLLMLPIKAACQIGWFRDEDKHHLLMMVKEVSDGFSCIDKMNIEPSCAQSCVSNIISRFYPNMKVENILTSFDVKAGYGTFVVDFVISLGTLSRKRQNLWLLVARLDNMETAACVEIPPKVDFLINGTKVPKRNKSDMGTGPQLPSNVTKTITHGVNLLQVIGDFDGPYIIAIAFMNLMSPDPPHMEDYLHPISAGVDSDCDAEMSSRISLDCPISQRRIKTPVKGHLCKHPQCFDYTYFMEINSKIPTWKCPLCNKPVCNLDIRIDQGFLKILNEVADDVSDVIISADGSWMVAMAEKSQTTETNRDTMSQNNHVANTAGNPISVEASDILPNSSALHNLCDSAICVSEKRPSTLLQPNVTTPAVSPPKVLRNPHLRSQDSCGTVPFSMQLMNPLNSTTTQPSCSSANPNQLFSESQGRTDQATQANLGTRTTLFMPVQPKTSATNSMHSSPLPLGQHRRAVAQQHYTTPSPSEDNIHTTELAQCTTMFTPPTTSSPQSVSVAFEELREGDEKCCYKSPGQSEPAPTVRPMLQTQLPEASGDGMSSGRMRGSLRGDQLEAARLQFLAAPRQPIQAGKPWSRPTPTHPMSLLMQQPPTNSENV